MQLQLKSPKIWLATTAIDFRKGPNSLREWIASYFNQKIEDGIYIFYNTARNKLKLLGYHRNGITLIYKMLDKKKFTVQHTQSDLYEINEDQLSWLLAGLNWIDMSGFKDISYQDYF